MNTKKVATAFAMLSVFALPTLGDTITLTDNGQFNGHVEFNGRVFTVKSKTEKGEKNFTIVPELVKNIELNDTDSTPGGISPGIIEVLSNPLFNPWKGGQSETASAKKNSKPVVKVNLLLTNGQKHGGILLRIGSSVELKGEKEGHERNEVRLIYVQ
jgi:hypothetical protein